MRTRKSNRTNSLMFSVYNAERHLLLRFLNSFSTGRFGGGKYLRKVCAIGTNIWRTLIFAESGEVTHSRTNNSYSRFTRRAKTNNIHGNVIDRILPVWVTFFLSSCGSWNDSSGLGMNFPFGFCFASNSVTESEISSFW